MSCFFFVIVNIHYIFIFHPCLAIGDAAEELKFTCKHDNKVVNSFLKHYSMHVFKRCKKNLTK